MSIDLQTLKENDLRSFSFADTKNVIAALEKIRLHNLDGIEAIEKVETYYAFAKLIKNKVDNHEFEELTKRGKDDIKQLHITLDLLLASFKFSLDGNRLQKQMSEIDQKVQNTSKDYNKKKNELDNRMKTVNENLDSFKKQIETTEHKTLTHVLTLMGIFTAVIVIIMSLVISSSSWLNSAHDASAIIAFVIPNSVAILSVIILLSLVFIYQRSILNISHNSKGSIVFFSTMFIAVLLLCCIIASIAINYTEPQKAMQTRYVISSEEYNIVEEVDDKTGQKNSFCEFTFEGVDYKFIYNDKYLHDGNLYFCVEQKTLE